MYLKYIPTIIIFLTLLLIVIKDRTLIFKEYGVVLIIAINIISDFFAFYLVQNDHSTNLLYSIAVSLEIGAIFFIYGNLFQSKKPLKLLFHGLMLAIFLFSIVNLLFIQKHKDFNTLTFIPFGFIVSLSSYMIIRNRIIKSTIKVADTIYWMIGANFIYFALVIPTICALPLTLNISTRLAESLQYINVVSYIIWSLIILIAFICRIRPRILFSS